MSDETSKTPIPDNVLRQAEKAEELLKGEKKEPVVENDGHQDKIDAIQHKYDVLQGKYNAEVPRLNASLTDARTKINEQGAEIEALSKATEENEQLPILDVEKFKEQNFEEEIIDLVNTVNNIAANQTKNTTQDLEKKVNKHEEMFQSSEERKTEEAESVFFGKIGKAVDDWETINNDPKFVDWLSGIDNSSGLTKHEILTIARERLNPQAAINIFKAFKNNGKRKVRDLTNEVVPDATFATEIPANKTSGVTQAEVAKAASDFARGRLSEKEFNKIANEFQKTL